MTDLLLRPLRIEDEAAALAAQSASEGGHFLYEGGPTGAWTAYVRTLARWQAGVDLPPGKVAASFLVAEVGDALVGSLAVRHRLTDHLFVTGGLIGYEVLPRHRRRGYATEMLRQALPVARDLGIVRVLVTCDDDNVGSATVIERCGGRLDADHPLTDGDVPKRRYWIEGGSASR